MTSMREGPYMLTITSPHINDIQKVLRIEVFGWMRFKVMRILLKEYVRMLKSIDFSFLVCTVFKKEQHEDMQSIYFFKR